MGEYIGEGMDRTVCYVRIVNGRHGKVTRYELRLPMGDEHVLLWLERRGRKKFRIPEGFLSPSVLSSIESGSVVGSSVLISSRLLDRIKKENLICDIV